MGPAGAPNLAVCRHCGAHIASEDSYSGYCFSCLLAPALASDDQTAVAADSRFDHYEVLKHPDGSLVELGRGSMGITYEAVDTTLQFPVALKVINWRTPGEKILQERFLREARAAARLRHPHVASVLYYGVRSDGQCFYTMEFVEGETLAKRIQRSGPLPVADALEVISQVADALGAAEKHGLVHRDLKPANLMLLNGPGTKVKIIDFGLAKSIGDKAGIDAITQSGFLGTPAFASPEQFSGGQIDHRSDYFSLGSTFFYLLTGTLAFQANEIGAVADGLKNTEKPVERLRKAGIPLPVRHLVGALLSADPADRPQSGTALTTAIAKCKQELTDLKPKQRANWKSIVGLALVVGIPLLTGIGILIYALNVRNETPAKPIGKLPSNDPLAYELYLHATDLMQHADEQSGAGPYFTMVRLLEEATRRDPSFFAAWEELAVVDDSLYTMRADYSPGRRALAQAAINAALKLQPDNPDVHLEMAIHVFSTERDFKRALEEAKIATRSTVQAHRAYILMGEFSCCLGQWKDALASYQKAYEINPKIHTLLEDQITLYQRHRNYAEALRVLDQAASTGSSFPNVVEQTRAEILWQEKGDTSAYQSIFDDPSGSLHPNGTATQLKIMCALANRDFAGAQKILDADPAEEFSNDAGQFTSRNDLQGWIARSKGDEAGARNAYEKARSYYLSKVQKWADDPVPLMSLAIADAALGRKQEAIQEANQAVAMRPVSKDAVDGPPLLANRAQVYLWVGEKNLALEQLEALQNVPNGLNYGHLSKSPTWDAIRPDARFQKLLSSLGPIPIENRGEK
jgi:serine/threonine protein kinase/Tfp pilus assembly protein PilF